MTSLNGCCGSGRAVLTWLGTSDQVGLRPESYAPSWHALGNANRDWWPHEGLGEHVNMSFQLDPKLAGHSHGVHSRLYTFVQSSQFARAVLIGCVLPFRQKDR